MLGVLAVGVCGALFEVGRRLGDLIALLRELPATAKIPSELSTDIRSLAHSTEGSLERTERMEGEIRKIQGDTRKMNRAIGILVGAGRRSVQRIQGMRVDTRRIQNDLRRIQGDIRRSRTSTRLLARSGYRSLERSQRLESEIENLAAEGARSATTQRRIIAAVETERLAAAEREQAVISKIGEAGERLSAARRGDDLFHDMRVFLPSLEIETIFDVGADAGESTKQFRFRFPEARIYSFEPIRDMFLQLEADVGGEARGEAVQLKTLDSFCEQEGIPGIDLLKIDTEGRDLEVLEGAEGMLSREGIGVVQVEAGLSPENDLQVPLDAVRTEFEKHGYRLFGFYEQVGDSPTQGPQLRRTSAVFIAGDLISTSPAVPSRR